LRTRFPILDDGSGAQEVLPEWGPTLETVVIPEGADDAREQSLRDWSERTASRPFSLTSEPAFRASIARVAPDEHRLLLVFHHIAFDGWSFGVVVRDLGAAYTAFASGAEPELPPLPLRYADYAAAQREWLEGDEAERQRQRWAKILASVPAELELPFDRPRPRHPSYRVERLRHVLPADFRTTFDAFSETTRATPFMILMGALQVLLGRCTGRRDFVVGFPLANRQDRADLGDLVGSFINILLLRADLSGEPTFLDILRRVRRAAFEAFPHQKLPFDEVVKIVRPDRSLTHVMFNYRDYSSPRLRLGELACEALDYDPGMSAVDLSLEVNAHHTDTLTLEFEYARDLFDRSTIERFAADYVRLLRDLLRDPNRPVFEPATTSAIQPHAVCVGRDQAGGDPSPFAASDTSDRRLTDLERLLLPIWRETLGIRDVGPDDDFFDLGGQSLQAVHLVSLAERALGGRIPLGWIFEHPTASKLAAAIERRPVQPAEGVEFVIPFRGAGSRPPLFCVHGVRGGVFVYREVANLLGPEQPVYGFILVGRPLERIPRSVEAMAERYIEEMRIIQPEGPYRILGYSFGCLVAYEMARRLEAAGQQIGLIGLVAPPRKLQASRPVGRLLRRSPIPDRTEPSIYSVCIAAARSYRPLPYAGRVVYFQEERGDGGGDRLWRGLAGGGLDVHPVSGGHFAIMRSENAQAFARELEGLLETRPPDPV
jgi:syringomycin synthetase protein SyrE